MCQFMVNLLPNPAGDIAQRLVYEAMCIEMADLFLYGLCVTWRHKWVHDDVIKVKYFPHYLPFVRGMHRSPVDSCWLTRIFKHGFWLAGSTTNMPINMYFSMWVLVTQALGSLCRKIINNHDIDYVGETNHCLPWGRILSKYHLSHETL